MSLLLSQLHNSTPRRIDKDDANSTLQISSPRLPLFQKSSPSAKSNLQSGRNREIHSQFLALEGSDGAWGDGWALFSSLNRIFFVWGQKSPAGPWFSQASPRFPLVPGPFWDFTCSLHIQSWRTSVEMKQAGESFQGGGGLVSQSCPTLCNPIDCSLPGSSVHGISQARILEWAAISFSRGSFLPRDWIHISCISGGFFTNWATREACSSSWLSQMIRKVGLETLWTFWPLCYWNKQEGSRLLNLEYQRRTFPKMEHEL